MVATNPLDARVLILDDQEANVRLLECILRYGGYSQFCSLTDPREALERFVAFRPDLILLDLTMPYLDGVRVMELLRPAVPEGEYLPILILTADATPEARRRALSAGANDFLTKPFDNVEVLLRIKNLLETRGLYLRLQDRAERRVRELARMVNQARDAIIVHDAAGRILYWSKGAERLYGWAEAEVLGRGAAEFPPCVAGHDEAARAVAALGAWQGELRQRTKDGKEVIVESRWSVARDPEGRPGVVALNTDVTEKRQLEAQLFRTQRLESIGALAGGIAHDLNNVLTPLTVGLPLLALELADPVSGGVLRTMEASVRRGAEMVRQILTFARGTEGPRQPLSLRALIPEVGRMVAQTFPRSVVLETQLPRDLPPVSGDATQLYQVLMNLCLNARDAMPDGGRLTVAAAACALDEGQAAALPGGRPGDYVAVTVTDTGAGMPPDILGRIFEPFFTTKPPDRGTGLGLATVRGIVQGHGGFVTVASAVGRGTEFRVYLPVAPRGEAQPFTAPPPLPGGNGELILVADDEAAIGRMVKTILEASGYRTVTAGTGAEAVALFAEHLGQIRAAVVDVMMPDLDGPAAIRVLRDMDPRTRVVATSGRDSTPQECGADAFLLKPYTPEKLLKTLHEVLEAAPAPPPVPGLEPVPS